MIYFLHVAREVARMKSTLCSGAAFTVTGEYYLAYIHECCKSHDEISINLFRDFAYEINLILRINKTSNINMWLILLLHIL